MIFCIATCRGIIFTYYIHIFWGQRWFLEKLCSTLYHSLSWGTSFCKEATSFWQKWNCDVRFLRDREFSDFICCVYLDWFHFLNVCSRFLEIKLIVQTWAVSWVMTLTSVRLFKWVKLLVHDVWVHHVTFSAVLCTGSMYDWRVSFLNFVKARVFYGNSEYKMLC